LKWAEPIGFGELQLTAAEFYRMTPKEFLYRLEGFNRLQDREWERTIKTIDWLLKHKRKQNAPAISPRMVLGRHLVIWPHVDDDGDS